MTVPTMRPLSFGEILDGAFTLYRRHFLRFVGTSALLMAGLIVGIVFLGVTGVAAASVMPGPVQPVVLLVVGIAILALATMMWSTLTWQAARAYQGKPAPLGDALDAAVQGAMTLLGSGAMAAVAVGAAVFGAGVGAGVLQAIVDVMGSPALSGAASVAGGVGIMAAGLFSVSYFFGVLPAVTVEEAGPWDALVRSVRLAHGALPRVAGMLLVACVIVTLPSLAVMGLTGGFAQLANPELAELATLSMTAIVTQQLLSILVSVLTAPFLPAVMVLLYYDRRVRTEALDVQIATARLELAGT
jgi:hypothetical protein